MVVMWPVEVASGLSERVVAAARVRVAGSRSTSRHASDDLAPNFASAYNNLGRALARQKRFDEAVAAYKESLALSPDFVEAHHNLGFAFSEWGEWEEQTSKLPRPRTQFQLCHHGDKLWLFGGPAA